MRAAEHHGVDGRQVVFAEVFVQCVHYDVVVVELAVFDDFYQSRARFGEDRVIGLESVHKHGEFAFAQGERGGGDDDALAVPMPTIAGDLKRRFHTDDRNVIRVAQRIGGGRGGGIAGDDDGLHALFHELFHNAETQFAHLLGGFGAVRRMCGIPEIQYPLVGHVPRDLADHRDAAETGIEYADWCR